MRNRAKCKLCNDIIESMHADDLQVCKCGAIGVDGGDAMRCSADDWNNFLRVDDNGNEIIPKIQEKEETINQSHIPTKKELIDVLDEMRKNIDNLPSHAIHAPVTHSDFSAFLAVLSAILRSD